MRAFDGNTLADIDGAKNRVVEVIGPKFAYLKLPTRPTLSQANPNLAKQAETDRPTGPKAWDCPLDTASASRFAGDSEKSGKSRNDRKTAEFSRCSDVSNRR
jgi:hypothetical protein